MPTGPRPLPCPFVVVVAFAAFTTLTTTVGLGTGCAKSTEPAGIAPPAVPTTTTAKDAPDHQHGDAASIKHTTPKMIVDVPSDTAVEVNGRALKACVDEYEAPPSCNAAPTPGMARRYIVGTKGGATLDVTVKRDGQSASHKVAVPPGAVTAIRVPRLFVDADGPLKIVERGATHVDAEGTLQFVAAGGTVVGDVGESDPD